MNPLLVGSCTARAVRDIALRTPLPKSRDLAISARTSQVMNAMAAGEDDDVDLARWEGEGGYTEPDRAPAGTAWLEEHTGEIALRIWAPTLPALFAKAGEALAGLMLGGGPVPARETVHDRVTIEASDGPALLVAWLDELIYRAETKRVVFTRFEVQRACSHRLEAAIHGSSPATFRNPVKAATYHELSVEGDDGGGGHVARVVLDV